VLDKTTTQDSAARDKELDTARVTNDSQRIADTVVVLEGGSEFAGSRAIRSLTEKAVR
jgi:hypothetical protein